MFKSQDMSENFYPIFTILRQHTFSMDTIKENVNSTEWTKLCLCIHGIGLPTKFYWSPICACIQRFQHLPLRFPHTECLFDDAFLYFFTDLFNIQEYLTNCLKKSFCKQFSCLFVRLKNFPQTLRQSRNRKKRLYPSNSSHKNESEQKGNKH